MLLWLYGICFTLILAQFLLNGEGLFAAYKHLPTVTLFLPPKFVIAKNLRALLCISNYQRTVAVLFTANQNCHIMTRYKASGLVDFLLTCLSADFLDNFSNVNNHWNIQKVAKYENKFVNLFLKSMIKCKADANGTSVYA